MVGFFIYICIMEYIISSFYLYDNQLPGQSYSWDYFILTNHVDYTGCASLPYSVKEAVKTKDTKIIIEACSREDVVIIDVRNFIKFVKINTSYNPSYNAYDIYWDEESSGINLFTHKYALHYNNNFDIPGIVRLLDYKHNRNFIIRDNKLNSILDD